MILASTGYSILILRSDAEFAEFGRDSIYQLIRTHVAAGEKYGSTGSNCSYWYAFFAGARTAHSGGPGTKTGTLLIVETELTGNRFAGAFPDRTLIDETFDRYRFGRTMGSGIGLYSNTSGDLAVGVWG